MAKYRLSVEEEKDLAYKMRKGDINARNALITSQVGNVEALTRGYADEDLTQECLLRFMNRIPEFNPAQVSLYTFTSQVVDSTIKRYTHPKNPGASLLDDNEDRQENYRVLADATKALFRKRVCKCLDKLKKSEMKLFQEYFIGDAQILAGDKGKYCQVVKKVKESFSKDPILSRLNGKFNSTAQFKKFMQNLNNHNS